MVRRGRQRAEQGKPMWRNAFGYRPDGSREPDAVTAPLVRQAYAAILAGASLGDVCRLWNDAGAYTLTGKPWNASLVSAYLRKPRNAGLRDYNGEIVGEATWPALIDEATWRAAQAVLDAPGRRPGRKSVRRHLLTGVLNCGKCGHYLSGQVTTQGTTAYGCKRCHRVSIRAEHVEPLLYGVVAERLAMPDAVDLLKAEVHDEAEAEQIRLQIATLYSNIDRYAVEHADGLLTARQVKIITDRDLEKIAALERRQQDQERLRVFDGLPLGTSQVADAVAGLSADRFRAVAGVLMSVTVEPVGKRGHVFNPERVQMNWR
jgi:hypothetical protein